MIPTKIKPMILRPATAADLEFLWRLRNDPVTRRWSRNQAEISLEEHTKWFLSTRDLVFIAEHTTSNGFCHQYGVVRVITHPHETEIGIIVAPEWRGAHRASDMIKAVVDWLGRPVVAYIRGDNVASIRAFERVGFSREDSYYKYTYTPQGKNPETAG